MPDIATVFCYLVLIVIAIVDSRTRQIPDMLTILLIAFGTFGICLRAESLLSAVLSMLIVGLPLLLFAVRTGNKIGGGDVKLIAAAAFCFGALPVLWVLCLTMLLMLITSRIKGTATMPMAPYFTVCSLLLLI